ncbi:MAG: carboxypeptidase-like regulatory domain-containing protein [bacterium]|nr:carboxypeptidase-like regulatory domain-containing protein [bacterium]
MKLKINNILLLFTIIFLSSANINCNYFISGGNPVIDSSNIGNVEGIVKDISTGNPITGVIVKIDDLIASTDLNGIYSIKNIGAGDRLITAEKTGYQFYSNTVRVGKGSTTAHNIQMLKVKTVN